MVDILRSFDTPQAQTISSSSKNPSLAELLKADKSWEKRDECCDSTRVESTKPSEILSTIQSSEADDDLGFDALSRQIHDALQNYVADDGNGAEDVVAEEILPLLKKGMPTGKSYRDNREEQGLNRSGGKVLDSLATTSAGATPGEVWKKGELGDNTSVNSPWEQNTESSQEVMLRTIGAAVAESITKKRNKDELLTSLETLMRGGRISPRNSIENDSIGKNMVTGDHQLSGMNRVKVSHPSLNSWVPPPPGLGGEDRMIPVTAPAMCNLDKQVEAICDELRKMSGAIGKEEDDKSSPVVAPSYDKGHRFDEYNHKSHGFHGKGPLPSHGGPSHLRSGKNDQFSYSGFNHMMIEQYKGGTSTFNPDVSYYHNESNYDGRPPGPGGFNKEYGYNAHGFVYGHTGGKKNNHYGKGFLGLESSSCNSPYFIYPRSKHDISHHERNEYYASFGDRKGSNCRGAGNFGGNSKASFNGGKNDSKSGPSPTLNGLHNRLTNNLHARPSHNMELNVLMIGNVKSKMNGIGLVNMVFTNDMFISALKKLGWIDGNNKLTAAAFDKAEFEFDHEKFKRDFIASRKKLMSQFLEHDSDFLHISNALLKRNLSMGEVSSSCVVEKSDSCDGGNDGGGNVSKSGGGRNSGNDGPTQSEMGVTTVTESVDGSEGDGRSSKKDVDAASEDSNNVLTSLLWTNNLCAKLTPTVGEFCDFYYMPARTNARPGPNVLPHGLVKRVDRDNMQLSNEFRHRGYAYVNLRSSRLFELVKNLMTGMRLSATTSKKLTTTPAHFPSVYALKKCFSCPQKTNSISPPVWLE